jgi:hypothetical protein
MSTSNSHSGRFDDLDKLLGRCSSCPHLAALPSTCKQLTRTRSSEGTSRLCKSPDVCYTGIRFRLAGEESHVDQGGMRWC